MSDDVPPAFKKLTRNYGPIANLYNLDERIRLVWQLPIRYLNDALAPARKSNDEPDREIDVAVGFVTNGGFNAAIRHESEAVASCVFVGVPFLALKACRQMATRMDAASGLPVCDDAERLMVFDKPLEVQGTWEIPPGDLAANAFEEFCREDEVIPSLNFELAAFMFDIAMRYVAMHECMHFALGHARFCQAELGMDSFADATAHRGGLDPIVSQTMEYIADRHTVAGLVEDLNQGRLFHEWTVEVPECCRVDPVVWRRRILVATLCLISKLWRGHGTVSMGDLSASYPHPYVRALWMVDMIAISAGEESKPDIERAFALSIATLERNFAGGVRYAEEIERDLRLHRLTRASAIDRSSAVIRAKAAKIQHEVFRNYGPFYPDT